MAEAEGLYRTVPPGDPCYPDALHLLGLLASAGGRTQEALALLGEAVRLRPEVAPFHNSLGRALDSLGMHCEAGLCFTQALACKPNYVEAQVNFGNALHALGLLEEALVQYEAALASQPECVEALFNKAAALSGLERFEQAEAVAWEALRRKPEAAEPWNVLSVVHFARHRFLDAEQCARRSVGLRPDCAESWNNLGNALQEQDRMEEAEACYRAALRISPHLAEAHYNLGNARRRVLRLPEARACYEEAIRLNPGHIKAHWNLSLTLLLAGELERGWEEFEWRWRNPKTPPRRFRQPPWDGSPLEGRTILLHAEQGLGDTIQFIRYADLVKRAGAAVVVECPARLAPLVATAPGVDRVVGAGTPLPEFDVHAPLMSLPRLVRTTLSSVPARVPYLAVEEERRQRWRERMAHERELRVGLAWKGNPLQPDDRFRSVSWETLAPLTAVSGVTWFSLQYGERPGPSQGGPLVDLGPETEDLRDAAAAIEQLDLVISVDSAMAHLAGALGRPVWVLLAHLPDWRWLLGRQTTPWYPTARLFRQPRRGDWESVIADAGEALIEDRSKGRSANRYAS
ncbi:MAG: tetratricopeptide repeat protein [Bryobacteraceae bacterium]